MCCRHTVLPIPLPRRHVQSKAGDRLVIVEYYAPWCNACRALYPKICRIMGQHLDDVLFLKVNFEENKELARTLNVKASRGGSCAMGGWAAVRGGVRLRVYCCTSLCPSTARLCHLLVRRADHLRGKKPTPVPQ